MKTTTVTFERFCKQFTNGAGRKDRRFIEHYGDVSFEEAYPIYLNKINGLLSLNDKINAFENFLIESGVECINSNISESRYYYYNGMKYRFSSHIYPTGSMTSDFCIDLCADKELINNVKY